VNFILIEINRERIHPGDYTPLGFTTVFCKGCAYEYSSGTKEDERVERCLACMHDIDSYYKDRRPISIIKDGNGRNIAHVLSE